MELAKRGGGRWLAAAALAAVVAGAATPASAHGRVIIGGAVGYPAYPYYPYPPPYVVYPYPAGVYWDPAPPPGFVPGHWEVDYDRKGRRVRVWVPGHLR